MGAPEPWATRWGLEILGPALGNYSSVWFARRAGRHCVLKIGDPAARTREATALRLLCTAGRGCVVRLLEHDAAGAMLVERVLPGPDLRPVAARDDDAATGIAAALMFDLHRGAEQPVGQGADDGPPRVDLPDIGDLAGTLTGFLAAPDPRLDCRLVEAAAGLLADLMADPRRSVVHGDLHHANILRGAPAALDGPSGPWRVIDPHGWWGDPHAEVAALLLNPPDVVASHPAPGRLARRRIAIVAERTGWDRPRLAAWGFVGAVVASLWCLSEHGFVPAAPARLGRALFPDCE